MYFFKINVNYINAIVTILWQIDPGMLDDDFVCLTSDSSMIIASKSPLHVVFVQFGEN